MSSDPIKTPSSRRLLLIGAVALAIAGAIAANGVIARAHSERALVRWTDNQAIPTVALATLAPDSGSRDLTLPGAAEESTWTRVVGSSVAFSLSRIRSRAIASLSGGKRGLSRPASSTAARRWGP